MGSFRNPREEGGCANPFSVAEGGNFESSGLVMERSSPCSRKNKESRVYGLFIVGEGQSAGNEVRHGEEGSHHIRTLWALDTG